MIAWFKYNIIQIILILVTVTFGYANFTRDIKANADSISSVELRVLRFEEKLDRLNEKTDKGLNMLERIDERTKKL